MIRTLCLSLGSGSKLNLSKSKGLWPGGWRGRLDPPIALEWTSGMIKVLRVFVGIGDIEEANWRPRINVVRLLIRGANVIYLMVANHLLLMHWLFPGSGMWHLWSTCQTGFYVS